MTDNLLDQVIGIIAEQALLDPADINPNEPLTEMGLDSLALVESIYALEERFDIHIPFNANTDTDQRPELQTAATVAHEVRRLIDAKPT